MNFVFLNSVVSICRHDNAESQEFIKTQETQWGRQKNLHRQNMNIFETFSEAFLL